MTPTPTKPDLEKKPLYRGLKVLYITALIVAVLLSVLSGVFMTDEYKPSETTYERYITCPDGGEHPIAGAVRLPSLPGSAPDPNLATRNADWLAGVTLRVHYQNVCGVEMPDGYYGQRRTTLEGSWLLALSFGAAAAVITFVALLALLRLIRWAALYILYGHWRFLK